MRLAVPPYLFLGCRGGPTRRKGICPDRTSTQPLPGLGCSSICVSVTLVSSCPQFPTGPRRMLPCGNSNCTTTKEVLLIDVGAEPT